MGYESGSTWEVVAEPARPESLEATQHGRALPAPKARNPETQRGLPRVIVPTPVPSAPSLAGREVPRERNHTAPQAVRVVPHLEATSKRTTRETMPLDETLTFDPTVGRIRAGAPARPNDLAITGIDERPRAASGSKIIPFATRRQPSAPQLEPIVASAKSGGAATVDLDLARARRDDDPLRQSAILELSGLGEHPWRLWLGVGTALGLGGGLLAWFVA